MKKFVSIALTIVVLVMLAACTAEVEQTTAGIPTAFVGQWKCEEYASDGETDTSFYEMYIEEDGHFSIYDAAAGNPGISGQMSNDTGSTVDCQFNMDDFDVPFCWTIESEEATFDYELNGKTMKLGHNGVWMIFHKE